MSMILDSTAVRNLELVRNNSENKKYGSLLWVLDKTRTGMGARLLNRMVLSPLHSIEEINYRQHGVEELVNASVVRVGLSEILKEVKDVERISGKISNGNMMPKDCVALAKSLQALPSIRFQLTGFTSRILRDVDAGLPDMSDLAKLLSAAIVDAPPALMKDGGFIRDGFHPELDELREIGKNGKAIVEEVEERERERTGIKTLKIRNNRVFGYYIEVSNSFKDKVPEEYIRKQTLTTGERYITEELKVLEEKILTSDERALKLETRKIPSDIDYNKIHNLSSEAREKLNKIRPLTISQASRISGVNPSDIAILLVYLESYKSNE
jgi:DNA mismatch repair protein MutS